MEARYLRRFQWNARPSGARGHRRQSRGSWWGSIFHCGLHPGGGTSVLQHHPLKFQLAVAHLQDGFKQRTEVWGVARQYCGVGVQSPPLLQQHLLVCRCLGRRRHQEKQIPQSKGASAPLLCRLDWETPARLPAGTLLPRMQELACP